MKTNDSPPLLELLAQLGSSFDCASKVSYLGYGVHTLRFLIVKLHADCFERCDPIPNFQQKCRTLSF